MTLKIQHKRSAVKAKAPQPTDLEYGEIAVNYETSDPCIYIKDSANTIRRIGAKSGASVTTSDTAPASPSAGDLWYDSVSGRIYVYYNDGNSSQWVDTSPQGGGGGGTGSSITQGDTAPASPKDGDLWYDSVGGRTYVYYKDPNGSQWVDIAPQGGGGGGGGGTVSSIVQGNTSASVVDTGSDGKFVVTTEGTARMSVKASGIINFSNVPQYTDNASAMAGGLVPGDLFKNIAGILVIAS